MQPIVANGGAGDQGGGVGADAEEGDVAEVEQAGEADDDVEAEGDGGEDQEVAIDMLASPSWVKGKSDGDDERAEGEDAGCCGELPPSRAKRPTGQGDGADAARRKQRTVAEAAASCRT